jgi:hypothetical protein
VKTYEDNPSIYSDISRNTDFNSLVDAGYYTLGGGFTYGNKPTGFTYGCLIVTSNTYTGSRRAQQLLFSQNDNKIWTRKLISGTWSSWDEVLTQSSSNWHYTDVSQNTGFNSLVDAGYYTLGGSCTYTNKPNSFLYGFLIVTANTSTGSRRAQQLLFSQSDDAVYMRKRVSGTWSDWERIVTNTFLYAANGMMFHDLSVNTDLNDVYKSGYYVLSSSNTYINAPSGFRYGFAVVYSNNLSTSSKRFVQIIYDQENADIYMRSYALSNWTTWKRINSNADNSCSIKYDSANKWKITFGDFSINLVYKNIPNKHQANYNIDHITDIAGHTLCPEGTDIIGPAHINGEVDFIGGVHGYETTTSIKVLCDGVEQTLNSSLNKTANEIVVLMETSDISHVSLEEVWTRDIAISIKKNEILVSSKYTITSQSDLNITRMTNGGLMAAFHSIIGSAWMPTKILSPVPSGSPGTLGVSEKNFVCEFNTTYGNVRVENIVGHELPTYKGWWQNFYNEEIPRLKSYFDIINGGLVVHTGETFEGVAKYSFNPVVS